MENKFVYNGMLKVEPTLVKHEDYLGNISLSLEVDVKIELVSNGDCSFLLDENGNLISILSLII